MRWACCLNKRGQGIKRIKRGGSAAICDEKRGPTLFFCGLFRMRIVCYIGRRNTRKGSAKERTRKKNKKIASEFSGEKRIYEATERRGGRAESAGRDAARKEWFKIFCGRPLADFAVRAGAEKQQENMPALK